ncbi:Ff.00g011930.m01.CDS01 [Fusarium sp. VM40]|nr:Ff.00g011930.m01.CDS01 [Fusarium sp. VM40]
MSQRSRRGCWTCKRRHKKCDEKRPVCERCVQAGMTCEGYKTRLTWGPSNTATSTGAGVVLNPVRQPRAKTRSSRNRDVGNTGESMPDLPLDMPEFTSGQSPDELDLLCLQFESLSEELPDEDVAKILMESFTTTGYQTLTGRAGQDTLFRSDVLPLCESSISLRNACLAYQASLSADTSRWTPIYMQSALSNYLGDLDTPSRLTQDVTLATGVLLCSVSINSLYIWSPLLKGLHGVLQARELLSNIERPPLADHLLEVVALLDIPCFTLNRITPSLDIWKLYVKPNKQLGIEQTSGLPYTLVSLLADMASSTIENDLLQWPGEIGDDFVQIHLWEAFRFAGILHSRALVGSPDLTASLLSKLKTEVARMRVFAAIQAIINTGTFNFQLTLAKAILYPLFIAGLLAENDQEQRLTRVAFQYLMQSEQSQTEQMILDIIAKVWKFGKGSSEVSKLMMATEAAAELNVEIHLY